MNLHIDLTPTQRTAIERHQNFRASIAARAAELANRRTQIKLAAMPIAAVEAPLSKVPKVSTVEPDADVDQSDSSWFVVLAPGQDHLSVRDIQKAVCKYYKVSLAEMLSKRRTADIVQPRQIAMFLCKELTSRTLPELGRRFCGRDHTTVLHGVRKVERMAYADSCLSHDLVILRQKLTGSPL